MAETPTLFVCHGDDGGPRRHPCRRVQEALRGAGIEYDKVSPRTAIRSRSCARARVKRCVRRPATPSYRHSSCQTGRFSLILARFCPGFRSSRAPRADRRLNSDSGSAIAPRGLLFSRERSSPAR